MGSLLTLFFTIAIHLIGNNSGASSSLFRLCFLNREIRGLNAETGFQFSCIDGDGIHIVKTKAIAKGDCFGILCIAYRDGGGTNHNIIVGIIGSNGAEFEPACSIGKAHHSAAIHRRTTVQNHCGSACRDCGVIHDIEVVVARDSNRIGQSEIVESDRSNHATVDFFRHQTFSLAIDYLQFK